MLNQLITAVKRGNVDAVAQLLTPGRVFPILGKLAVRGGDVAMVKLLDSKRISWPRDIFSYITCDTGIDVLKVLFSTGCSAPLDLVSHAIEKDSLDLLVMVYRHKIPVYPESFNAAARLNRFAMVQYMHDMQTPWSFDAIQPMIRYGSVEMIRFALANDCPCVCADLRLAIRTGRLEVVKVVYTYTSSCVDLSQLTHYVQTRGTDEIRDFLNEMYVLRFS